MTNDDGFEENEILDIVNILKLFLQFICNKRIISIDKVNLMKENEDTEYTAEMNIYSSETPFKVGRHKILNYNLIKDFIGDLLQEIANNTICFRSLFNYEENYITNIDIMNICACFENQFKNTYPGYKDLAFKKVKKDICIYIENYVTEDYDEKCKYHFQEIKKWINYYKGTLKEKLEYALNDYKTIMGDSFILHRFSKNYENMPNKFKDARNALNHGNMKYQFSSDEYRHVGLVRSIIYMMILKKIGMDAQKIKECIIQMFE